MIPVFILASAKLNHSWMAFDIILDKMNSSLQKRIQGISSLLTSYAEETTIHAIKYLSASRKVLPYEHIIRIVHLSCALTIRLCSSCFSHKAADIFSLNLELRIFNCLRLAISLGADANWGFCLLKGSIRFFGILNKDLWARRKILCKISKV